MDKLGELLGIKLNIHKYEHKTSLPRYLLSGRQIYCVETDGIQFWLIRTKEVPQDSRNASKEIAIYQERLGGNTAYWVDGIDRVRRDAYVRHHIPFYALPDHVYLPFLGVVLSSRFVKKAPRPAEYMTVYSQMIFLKLLYSERQEYSKQALAKILDIDPVYVTRGTQQLKGLGLISERKQGKFSLVERTDDGKIYMDNAENNLVSPVKDVFYTWRSSVTDELVMSGISALAAYTMLNPSEVSDYAIYKRDQRIGGLVKLDEPHWQEPDKICRIEVWSYAPEKFSVAGLVDRVSLKCIFTNEKDERIQQAIEDMMEGMEWQ